MFICQIIASKKQRNLSSCKAYAQRYPHPIHQKEVQSSHRKIKSFLSVFILFTSFILVPIIANAGCKIFEHRDYGGAWYNLKNGERMIMVDGNNCISSDGRNCGPIYYPEWNDDVSSFKVTRGCTITLWEHIHQGGAHFRSSKSYSYVGDSWNDKASEALCECQ